MPSAPEKPLNRNLKDVRLNCLWIKLQFRLSRFYFYFCFLLHLMLYNCVTIKFSLCFLILIYPLQIRISVLQSEIATTASELESLKVLSWCFELLIYLLKLHLTFLFSLSLYFLILGYLLLPLDHKSVKKISQGWKSSLCCDLHSIILMWKWCDLIGHAATRLSIICLPLTKRSGLFSILMQAICTVNNAYIMFLFPGLVHDNFQRTLLETVLKIVFCFYL